MKVDVAIIGAGVAGLAAGKILQHAGKSIAILEKSQGIGGRAATRRIDNIPVDHGAQFFTARTPEFQAEVADWLRFELCFVWTEGFHRWERRQLLPPGEAHSFPRYACRSGMTSLGKSLAAGLPVFREHLVAEITGSDGVYTLLCANGNTVQAETILSTAPPPQTLALLDGFLSLETCDLLRGVVVAPCLTAVVDLGSTEVAWRGIQIEGEDLSWIGADFSKRQPGPPRRLAVIHGAADFSREHLEDNLEATGRLLLARAAEYDSALQQSTLVQTHRWRYARVEQPLQDYDFLSGDPARRIFVAGDAFLLGNIEAAWLSGTRVAQAILNGG